MNWISGNIAFQYNDKPTELFNTNYSLSHLYAYVLSVCCFITRILYWAVSLLKEVLGWGAHLSPSGAGVWGLDIQVKSVF